MKKLGWNGNNSGFTLKMINLCGLFRFYSPPSSVYWSNKKGFKRKCPIRKQRSRWQEESVSRWGCVVVFRRVILRLIKNTHPERRYLTTTAVTQNVILDVAEYRTPGLSTILGSVIVLFWTNNVLFGRWQPQWGISRDTTHSQQYLCGAIFDKHSPGSIVSRCMCMLCMCVHMLFFTLRYKWSVSLWPFFFVMTISASPAPQVAPSGTFLA